MTSEQWFWEKDNYLHDIYNNNNISDPQSTEFEVLSQWVEALDPNDSRYTTNTITLIINRIPLEDPICRDKMKDLIAKKGLLAKKDFNQIRSKREKFSYSNKELNSKKKGKKEEEEMLINSSEIANDILHKIKIYSPKEYKKSILVYRKGSFKEEPMDYLDRAILRYFKLFGFDKEEDSKQLTKLKTVKHYIREETYCSIKEFDSYIDFFNIKNGILDISDLDNITLLDHDPKYKMMIQIPLIYDPNAKCEKIEDTFEFVLGNKDQANRIYESIGDALTGKPDKYQKFDIFIGEGDNGKSTLLNVIREFLGIENCSETSLQDLSTNDHAKADLENKLANFFPDLPSKYIKDVSTIKLLTGDPYFRVNRKFIQSYNAPNHCKNYFSCNKLPILSETTKAMYRRINLFACNNVITKERRDPDILKKLTTKEELSGLLNLALEGLRRLRERKGYDKKYSENIEEQYERLSNPLLIFIENYLDFNPKDWDFTIEKERLLDVVNIWLKRINQDPIKASNSLTRQLNRIRDYKIETKDCQIDGIKKHYYIHVQFNEKAIREFKLDNLELIDDFDFEDPNDINSRLGIKKESKPKDLKDFSNDLPEIEEKEEILIPLEVITPTKEYEEEESIEDYSISSEEALQLESVPKFEEEPQNTPIEVKKEIIKLSNIETTIYESAKIILDMNGNYMDKPTLKASLVDEGYRNNDIMNILDDKTLFIENEREGIITYNEEIEVLS